MRDYAAEYANRVEFIKTLIEKSGAKGIVYGNSGGKDSALVGILCKAACENTVGIIMPCTSKRNYNLDMHDANAVAVQFGIETRVIDLSPVKEAEVAQLQSVVELNRNAISNIAPRLRMTTLYAVAAAEGRLVAGTGNKSEAYVGYFTKWGDGAHDFNPISDLTATEIIEFLKYLNAPNCIITKAPSAGLFDGQTDENELGFTYKELDEFLETGVASAETLEKIERLHSISQHKREEIARFAS